MATTRSRFFKANASHASPYRSSRAVPPSANRQPKTSLSSKKKWRLIKFLLLLSGTALIFGSLYLPYFLQMQDVEMTENELLSQKEQFMLEPGMLISKTKAILEEEHSRNSFKANLNQMVADARDDKIVDDDDDKKVLDDVEKEDDDKKVLDDVEKEDLEEHVDENKQLAPDVKPEPAKPITRNVKKITLEDLKKHPSKSRPSSLARGVSGLPSDQTPDLEGAKRGHIQCDVDVDFLAYWNDPVGKPDIDFQSPHISPKAKEEEQYLTFELDCGGWNNLRMSMETVFVFAMITGRTLVLPPEAHLYLLTKVDQGGRMHRGFADYFDLKKRSVEDYGFKIITMEEFINRESESRFPFINDVEKKNVTAAMKQCEYRRVADHSCFHVNEYLTRIGHVIRGTNGKFEGHSNCYIFDDKVLENAEARNQMSTLDAEKQASIKKFCGTRVETFYDKETRDTPVLHLTTYELKNRLLQHFYNFFYFSDPSMANIYKRFVRDFLHYNDEVFCAAGKIILSLQAEAHDISDSKASIVDAEGSGGYSSFHIRYGDFQFKETRIEAKDIYENTKDVLPNESEIMYIATDERDKSKFNDLVTKYEVRFLDDYIELASLKGIDPTYFGMIDTIVASRGRVFVGTYYSTFTGYINRIRGYAGTSMKMSYYSTLQHKTVMHDPFMTGQGSGREWEHAWVGIDSHVRKKKPLGRGSLALPMAETPALEGASRAHIECDVNVDELAYWNQPQGKRDINFAPPFEGKKTDKTKYISFVPDKGGWNNIRMNMEIVFIIAAATGRTLVLPPPVPVYLLSPGQSKKGKPRHKGFADFIPIEDGYFQKQLPVISFEDFIKKEGGEDGQFPIPESIRDRVQKAAGACDKRAKSDIACDPVWEYLETVGFSPYYNGHTCIVFDDDAFNNGELTEENQKKVDQFCFPKKDSDIVYFNTTMQDNPLIHFRQEKKYRMFAHFYGYLKFTDVAKDNHYKRFVRDYLRYHDEIYCAAGKIVQSLQKEGKELGFDVDEEEGGGYSSLHVRRGDLQYKKVKITAEEWRDNLKDTWKKDEILYIATDERNKTFFDPLKEGHEIRFLDDYWDMAGLSNLDSSYMSMIDTIVASRGRSFGGTFFSTFTGYINRMRGYHGMTMKDSWYSFLPKKNVTHEWKDWYDGGTFSFEWPTGWVEIDGDKEPSREKF